ncbi:DNA-3-methyladenine glycosylase 2 family protein [Hoyosella sp. YIM 151337]|uniref:DNA-3-methyladenine glycosylase family protein n=1 Tax=Hoyosella sp. YIM 151337 TaxID=2992742 RepID=UPI0022368CBF|nr:DNA-3-methyladenine glycosylase 2 family protein [Hoyosella sp. YIM 151337]MCW4351690.1 DNA-3-methyladenine glycosylase 2 family protein [Hoyosella sp. YIM 151337]
MLTLSVTHQLNAAATLKPLSRGAGDPCHHHAGDGAIWRASRMPSGVVTYRIHQTDAHTVGVSAWGPGADEFLTTVPELLGEKDDPSSFRPHHPVLREAQHRAQGVRICRTGRVMEALVPAILEQRVHGIAARASWRRLVRQFGTPAPGPAPRPMWCPPETWRWVPSWEFHKAGVDPRRAKTIIHAARRGEQLEQLTDPEVALAYLQNIPGVGVWTAAETAQRAFGHADALSVGDFHLAAMIGWTLLGRPLDDDAMVEYLAPLRPHRYRAVLLLGASGLAYKPKFGPRTPIMDHRGH